MYIVLICTYCMHCTIRRVRAIRKCGAREEGRGKNEENFTFVRKSLNRRLDEKVNNDDNGDEREIVLF